MMASNQPLYVEDHKSSDVYQVLDVIKDRSEELTSSYSSHINSEEQEEFEQVDNYDADLTTSRYSLGGQGNYRVLDVFMEVYGRRTTEIQ